MISDVLLAVGLLLSPASQLRPGGSAVGPGELCLALWLALALLRSIGRSDLALTFAPIKLITFWMLFAVALCVGAITAFVIGAGNDTSLLLHDIKAYVLVASIGFFCTIGPNASARLRVVAWELCTIGSVLLALQVLHGWGVFSISGIDPWFWDRLRGWSENPNQLALVCVVLGFIALHLAETAQTTGARLAALVCAVMPFWVGLLTKSDSFLMACAGAFAVLTGLKFWTWIQVRNDKPSALPAIAWAAILALPVVLVLAVPVSYLAADKLASLKQDFVENNRDAVERDAPERLALWKQAIERGLATSMLGLGPGPHLMLERAASLANSADGADVPHHSEDPKPNFEAHNTILDLFVQGGLLGVLAFGWIYMTAFFASARASLHFLAVLLCGLAAFGVFHLIIRHPLLWFVLALCLVAASAARPAPALQKGT